MRHVQDVVCAWVDAVAAGEMWRWRRQVGWSHGSGRSYEGAQVGRTEEEDDVSDLFTLLAQNSWWFLS